MLTVNAVPIDDTFAEAFPMTAARVLVTAETPGWAMTAARSATGYAASVIGCDAEAGIERELPPGETPDGRPGVSLLFFAFSRDALQKAVVNRVAQCVLTCPTTACFNGLAGDPGPRVGVVDEFALGLGVSLAVLSEARGERSLQPDVIGCEPGISSETVPKTQALVEVLALIH